MANDKSTPKRELTAIQQTISGSVAGVVSRTVISPLDVLKIRFQMQTNQTGFKSLDTRKYKTIYGAFQSIIREEGILALWKGNLPATIMYFVYGGVQFLSYYELNNLLCEYNLAPKSTFAFISGAGAGVLATICGYPLDLLRTRFAVQGNNKLYRSLIGAIVDIKQKEGFKGFYKGLLPSILSIMPQMGLVFHFYSVYNGIYEKHLLPLKFSVLDSSKDLITGGLAGITSKVMVLPLDVVRYSNF